MKTQQEEQDTLEMKTYNPELKSLKTPFASTSKGIGARGPAPANNIFGLCSIQDFSGVFGNHKSDLSQTHADTQGFYDYMNNFYTPNYWFKDGAVKTWEYEEPYDHWQNLYGVDAVLVFYHSGHGNMDSNGVFQAPMGGFWNNESWFLSNNKVHFANQKIRYIFWSTCFSCRVSDGNSPVRTWWADDNNPGFRMLFGYDTTSVDDPNYGKYFWNHWRNNESFSTAFLNASWDIYHNQSPCCMASGSDQNDASNRLFNERLFYWDAVARNWFQWRWYYASTRTARNKSLPSVLKIAEFETETFTSEHVHRLADVLQMRPGLGITKDGFYSLSDGDKAVSVNSQNHLNIKLGEIDYQNRTQLNERQAIQLAEENIKRYNLHAGEEYVLDVVRLGKTAGGLTRKGSQPEKEFITDTMVQYRQVINGVPSVNSDNGLIRVTMDNSGHVTDLHSSFRKIAQLHHNPKGMMLDPMNENSKAIAKTRSEIEKEFTDKLSGYQTVRMVEEETGYDVAYTYGRIVTTRVYEVAMEQGLKKLIKVMVSHFE